MLNDQDKYEGDDTEYHFSDEEVNYDVDAPDAPKAAPETTSKSGGVASTLQSKRMLISFGVFIVLVLVVYKMVTPAGTATPDTEIRDIKAPIVSKQPPAAVKDMTQAYNTNTSADANGSPALAAQGTTQTVQMPAAPTAPPPQMVPPEAAAPQTPPQMPPQTPSGMPSVASVANQAAGDLLATATSAMGAANQPNPPNPPPPQVAAPLQASMASMPPSIPTLSAPGAGMIDSKAAALAAQNERLVSQLQTQYDQRISDYQSQNKNLQEQVQTLNSRVAGMENQLTQMMQNISREQQSQPKPSSSDASRVLIPVEPVPEESLQQRIAYSVQAIIPGRAWLKSDSGERSSPGRGMRESRTRRSML